MKIQNISVKSVVVVVGLAGLLSLLSPQVAFNQYGPGPPSPSSVVFTVNSLNGPTTVQVGQEVQFCAQVKNTGKDEGTGLIAFRVNEANVTASQKTLKPQEQVDLCFKHTFTAPEIYQVSVTTESSSKSMTVQVTGAASQPPAQPPSGPTVEISLIHSFKDLAIFPGTITVKKGTRVKLYNISRDVEHNPVIIKDASGALMPGTQPVAVRPGEITVVEFVAGKVGEYTISHELHGHKITGKLIVSE